MAFEAELFPDDILSRAEAHPKLRARDLAHQIGISEAALVAARSMGLSIAGVDLLQSDRGPLVLEVNSSPGLQGIEKATGKDIAGIIIDFVAKKVRKKREQKSKRKKIKSDA